MSRKKLGKAGVKRVDELADTALDRQSSPQPQPRKERPPEKRLSVMVPADVMRQIRRAMADEDATTRTIVLKALKDAGYEIPDDEITDRRVEANRARAQRDG